MKHGSTRSGSDHSYGSDLLSTQISPFCDRKSNVQKELEDTQCVNLVTAVSFLQVPLNSTTSFPGK